MKRTLILLAVFFASCASVANYPITLSYTPSKQYGKADGKTVAVALLRDNRTIGDKRLIGVKDNEVSFISLIDEPSVAISKAFKTYLENRGYAVKRPDEVWDGNPQAIRPEWGDLVIGGSLEDFTITAKGISLVKTEYACSVRLFLTFADPKTKEIRHRERYEVSTSYVTVNFSREKAEELINSALSDTVERALADVNKYSAKAGTP